MATIDPSPTADELKILAALFQKTEDSLQAYLSSDAGKKDTNFDKLTAACLSLINASDTIAVMQLHLAIEGGAAAVDAINKATSELQRAIVLRNNFTTDLTIVQNIVTFGAAIAAGDVTTIASSGINLFDSLVGVLGSSSTTTT